MYQPEEILQSTRANRQPTRGPPILHNGVIYEAQSIVGFDGIHYYAQPYLSQDDNVYYIQPVVDSKGQVFEADGFLAPNGLTYYAMPIVENDVVIYIRPLINPQGKVIYPDRSHPAFSSYNGDDLHALPDDNLYNENDVVEVEIQDTNNLDENGRPKYNVIVRNRKSVAPPENAIILPEGGKKWIEGDEEIVETVYLDNTDLDENGKPKEKRMRVKRKLNLPHAPSITNVNARGRTKRQAGPLPGEQLEREESLRDIPLTAEERARLEEFKENMSVQCDLQYVEGSLDLGEVIRKSFRIYSHGGSIDIDQTPEPEATFQPLPGRGWVPVSKSVPKIQFYEGSLDNFERTELAESLQKQGIEVPKDENGVPILTSEFIKSLPKELRVKPEAKKAKGPGQDRDRSGSFRGPADKGGVGPQIQGGKGPQTHGGHRGSDSADRYLEEQEQRLEQDQGPYDAREQVLDEYGFPLQGSEVAKDRSPVGAKSSGQVHGYHGVGYKQGRSASPSQENMLRDSSPGAIPTRSLPFQKSRGQLDVEPDVRGITIGSDGGMLLNGVPVTQIHGDNGVIIRQVYDENGHPTDNFVDENGQSVKLYLVKGEDDTINSSFVNSEGIIVTEVPAFSSKAGPLPHGVPVSSGLSPKMGSPTPGPGHPDDSLTPEQPGSPAPGRDGTPYGAQAPHGEEVPHGTELGPHEEKKGEHGASLEAPTTVIATKLDSNGVPLASDAQGEGVPPKSIIEIVSPDGMKIQQITSENGKVVHEFEDEKGKKIIQYVGEDGKAIQQFTNDDGQVIKQFIGDNGKVVQQFQTANGKTVQQTVDENGDTVLYLVNSDGETLEIADPLEYGITPLTKKDHLFANPLLDSKGNANWKLNENGFPVAVDKEGHIVPSNWMIGAAPQQEEQSLVPKTGLRIKGSRTRPVKPKETEGEKSSSDSDSFDFSFKADGKILNSQGRPVSLKWQVMDGSGNAIPLELDPDEYSFEGDGKIYDAAGNLLDFNWKLVDDYGDEVPIDAEIKEEEPPPVRTGIRFESGYVLAGPDGNIIKPITSGLHIVHSRGAFHLNTTTGNEDDLLSPTASPTKIGAEIIGPSGAPLMRVTESGRIAGPHGSPLEIGARILDPRGNPIQPKGQVVGPDGLPIFLIQTGHRKGSELQDDNGTKIVEMEQGMAILDRNGNMLMMFDTGGQVTSSKGNFRMAGQIGANTLEVYDYFIMDIGGGDIQENKIQRRLQKMIDKYVAPPAEEEETQTQVKSFDKKKPDSSAAKHQGTKRPQTVRKGPGLFDFPECLKGTEWRQFRKPSTAKGAPLTPVKKSKQAKKTEVTTEDLILEDEEETEETASPTVDEDAAWEALWQSGFLEHIDEEDPDLIAKNKDISALNKFKLHPIKKQHWDVRKALDGTRPVTRQEVAFHCDNGDILLIRNRRVINAMNIVINHVNEHQDKILPLINMKGTDISHWFDPITGEPRTKIDLKTGKRILHTPNGFYYGLGPIRRQLEQEQESTRPSTAHSSAKSEANVNYSAVDTATKDYRTYATENYSDKDVSGFAPAKHRDVVSGTEDVYVKEVTEEDQNVFDELEVLADLDMEIEMGGEEEEIPDEMDEFNGAFDTSKKSIKSRGSGESSTVETPPLVLSSKQIKSPGHSNGSSPENISPQASVMISPQDKRGSSPHRDSKKSVSSGPTKKSIPGIASSEDVRLSPNSKKSLKEGSDENRLSPKTKRSLKEGDEHERRSSEEGEKDEHKSRGSKGSNPKIRTGSNDSLERDKKSSEEKSESTSPLTLSPKSSPKSLQDKSKILVMTSPDEEENEDRSNEESEGNVLEDLEDVFSRTSIAFAASIYSIADTSQFGDAASMMPHMGSAHSLLSDIPSNFSKSTIDTTAVTSTVYGVQPNLYPESTWSQHDPYFEEKWWLDPKYICGYVPRSTLNIRIINSLSYDERVLVISKEYTINDIMRYYLPYNLNAMGYRWEDMFGNILHPDRTVVENGLVDFALAEDNGFNCYPVIILVFIDGFEDEPIISLDPKELAKQMVVTPICRNY